MFRRFFLRLFGSTRQPVTPARPAHLAGPPPPPPPPPSPRPAARVDPEPLVGEKVQLFLEDGSVVALPAHPVLERQIAYLASNLIPERRPRPQGESVRLVFHDGSEVPLGTDSGVEGSLVSYLAGNILPPRRA